MFIWNEDMIRFCGMPANTATTTICWRNTLPSDCPKTPMCVTRAVGWGTSACSWPPTADK